MGRIEFGMSHQVLFFFHFSPFLFWVGKGEGDDGFAIRFADV